MNTDREDVTLELKISYYEKIGNSLYEHKLKNSSDTDTVILIISIKRTPLLQHLYSV